MNFEKIVKDERNKLDMSLIVFLIFWLPGVQQNTGKYELFRNPVSLFTSVYSTPSVAILEISYVTGRNVFFGAVKRERRRKPDT